MFAGDICHQVLFPISYAKSHQGGGGTQCSDREACSLVRLVAQLERTIALNDPDFQPVLDKRKLRRMNQLNQRPVPAVVYQSNLPAVGVSRRERLLSAAYNGLAYALKNPEFVRIVHLLPHFQVRSFMFRDFCSLLMTSFSLSHHTEISLAIHSLPVT